MNPESERDDDRSERTKQSYLRFTIGKSCMYFHWLGVDRNQQPATSSQLTATNNIPAIWLFTAKCIIVGVSEFCKGAILIF